MKTFFLITLCLALYVSVSAQSPQMFKYQAVLRNSSGAIVPNEPVSVRFTILQGAAATTTVYSETQSLTTDANGLLNTAIGSGTPVSGAISSIDWAAGPAYLHVETDPGNSGTYTDFGSSQLLSVPYAMYAESAGNTFSGDYNDLLNKPDFTGWDVNASNDFDGQYGSLSGAPTNVSSFVNDAGYLTSYTETDGDVTNELQLLSISNDTIYLTNGGFVKLPAGFDGQYSSLSGAPANVSAFTNDAGYITEEIDTTDEIQTLSISNDTLMISSGNAIKLPGMKITEFVIPTAFVNTYTATTNLEYFKIGDIGTFNKENDNTLLELIMNCHVVVSSYSGTNGLYFQVRIDDQPTSFGKMEFVAFNPNSAYTYFTPTGFFPGISSGQHTISVWAGIYWAGGTVTGVMVNPGGYNFASRMMVKEFSGTY